MAFVLWCFRLLRLAVRLAVLLALLSFISTFLYSCGVLDSVRATVEKITTKRTKQKHEDLMLKDFRYANSLGKVNARRKKIHQEEVAEAALSGLLREEPA